MKRTYSGTILLSTDLVLFPSRRTLARGMPKAPQARTDAARPATRQKSTLSKRRKTGSMVSMPDLTTGLLARIILPCIVRATSTGKWNGVIQFHLRVQCCRVKTDWTRAR